ncbi:MAG TPA: serine hydrolase domain-containing protein [Gaiellaceae bacterium]|nr:serine hydrolase domain-containing protein [Gaiellaceae bacterium]
MSAPEELVGELERRIRHEQREQRLPSIAAAVLRDGERVWESAVGAADVPAEVDATPDTQYRLGSITKTFTAAAIMQLRDAGKLDLEDTLDKHVDAAAHAPTLRRLLSHTSGLQRETHDDAWLKARFADIPELLDTLGEAEQVLPPGARYHYSNLAFALLGVVVERVSGIPYARYVEDRILTPLGLTRTTFESQEPAATGYVVQLYVEGVWAEAPIGTGAWMAAGHMWGTVRDLCAWASFLAAPDEAVLARSTLEEMRTVQTIEDHVRWSGGYGLGLMLQRDGDRILAGHGGSMPGFIAAVYVSPADKVGVGILTNSSGAALGDLAKKLVGTTVERWPVPPAPWKVEAPPPDDVGPLLGIWFMEADAFTLRWKDGKLDARFPGDPEWKPSAVLVRESADRWRVESGWEQGEVLRIERDAGGAIVQLVLAGYPVKREPSAWA